MTARLEFRVVYAVVAVALRPAAGGPHHRPAFSETASVVARLLERSEAEAFAARHGGTVVEQTVLTDGERFVDAPVGKIGACGGRP